MNFMIRTASVVALFTFWLAAIVWTVLIVAAPANADTGASGSTSSSGSSSTSAPAGAGKSSSVKPSGPGKDFAFDDGVGGVHVAIPGELGF